MTEQTEFGPYLQQLRRDRAIGLNQLAGKSGVSPAEVSRIENRRRRKINPAVIKKLAAALGVPYELLLQKAGYLEVGPDQRPGLDSLIQKVCNLSAREQKTVELLVDDLLDGRQ